MPSSLMSLRRRIRVRKRNEIPISFIYSRRTRVDRVSFNLVLETDPSIMPKIKLYHSKYNAEGEVTGYKHLGTWVGEDGYLTILNFDVEYNFFTNNDLFIELTPWIGLRDTPLPDDSYLLDFWCN